MSEYTFPTRTDATSTANAGKDYLIYLNTGTTECSLSTPHDDVATLKGTISGDGPLSEQSKG